MKMLLPLAAVLLAFGLSATTALAADDPKALIAGKYAEIQKVIATDKTDEGVRKHVVGILESFTDFKQFGYLTLKKYWGDLKEPQQQLFIQKYRQLIHKSYVKHFKANKELKVSFRGEPRVKGDKAMVMTTVVSGKTEAEVDYKLHTVDGKLMGYDIVIDDVSLMRSYRKQFSKIYKRDGFEKLIEKMTRKIEKGDGELEDP